MVGYSIGVEQSGGEGGMFFSAILFLVLRKKAKCFCCYCFSHCSCFAAEGIGKGKGVRAGGRTRARARLRNKMRARRQVVKEGGTGGKMEWKRGRDINEEEKEVEEGEEKEKGTTVARELFQ